jgi:hypothetical protein
MGKELVGNGVAVQQVADLVAAWRPLLPHDLDGHKARLPGGPDPLGELLSDRQVQVLLSGLPRLQHPAIQPSQAHRLAQRLVGTAVPDTDQQQPPGRGVQLSRLGQQVQAGHVRHPLVGDDHRDRHVVLAQPHQSL